MSSERDAQSVLASYLPRPESVRKIEPLGRSGGWSGSALWKVTDGAGNEFCLRRWPREHPTQSRLSFIHKVVCHVKSAIPAVAHPARAIDGQTFVLRADHLWQLEDWRPGRADFQLRPCRNRLRAAMRMLAQFHLVAAEIESREGPVPAVVDREQGFQWLRSGGIREIEGAIQQPLGSELDERCQRLFYVATRAFGRSVVARTLPIVQPQFLQPAIRDIHHDHVLFTGDEVTGVIDFGALRIDTPLADIARLVGSLVGEDQEAWRFALDAYCELRAINESDRRLIDLLDESGLILAGFNWLKWLYVEPRDMGEPAAIARRIDQLLGRLQARASP